MVEVEILHVAHHAQGLAGGIAGDAAAVPNVAILAIRHLEAVLTVESILAMEENGVHFAKSFGSVFRVDSFLPPSKGRDDEVAGIAEGREAGAPIDLHGYAIDVVKEVTRALREELETFFEEFEAIGDGGHAIPAYRLDYWPNSFKIASA
jgi:hypothetical protein